MTDFVDQWRWAIGAQSAFAYPELSPMWIDHYLPLGEDCSMSRLLNAIERHGDWYAQVCRSGR